jgi:hypothetical protein
LRKLLSILLLAILVFNIGGYRLLIGGLKNHASSQQEIHLDRNAYDASDLISVKTKLHLPYFDDRQEFQRAYGSIVLDGITYDYVMRRMVNDTLELLCLPNDAKTALEKAKQEWTRFSVSQPVNGKAGVQAVFLPLPHYFQESEPELISPVVTLQRLYRIQQAETVLPGYSSLFGQPPRQTHSLA